MAELDEQMNFGYYKDGFKFLGIVASFLPFEQKTGKGKSVFPF